MSRQDLYLVFGGTLLDPRENVLADPDKVDVAGIYPTYDKALKAWRSRYFIAPLHRLMHPDESA